ncbi:MAG: site-specific integrase [Pirellula sp.]|nr:site-specific integrase [Pirellula sp.]
MPRLIEALPRYRKHRGSGQAIVTLGGRDFYLGPHGTKASRHQYDRLVCEWLANGRQPLVTDDDGLTVTELIARYWKFAEGHYVKDGKPTGEIGALRAAYKPLRELYGPTPAAEFGPIRLEALRGKMVGVGWSRGNVNSAINRVRRLFRWGVRKQLIPSSVAEALGTVEGLRRGRTDARETAPIMPVADDAVDAALAFLPAVVADMVRLQRLTGARPAEVCMLRPRDVDRSGDVWLYRPESHKTQHHGRERVIFIGPQAQAVLLRYLARDHEAFCFRPCDSMAKHRADRAAARTTPPTCGNTPGSNRRKKPRTSPGESYAVDAYRRAITRACDKAFPCTTLDGIRVGMLSNQQKLELKEWRKAHRWAPNQLRHAAATEGRREFGLEAAQIVLGHASAAVSQIYAERDLAKGLAVAKAIG